MATITLTGNTLSECLGVGSFTSIGTAFSKAKQTTGNLTKELSSLKVKIDVASTAANLDTSKQQTSNSKNRGEVQKNSLSLAYDKLDKLISNVGIVDNKVATKVEQLKNDFYSKYSYLKPESEKSKWEKFKDGAKNLWDGICDLGNAISNILVDVVAWCKEHWKLIVTAVLVIVAVVLICTGVGGPFAAIILAMCKGLIIGAITGGLMGGISSVASGGSFLEGFENGAFSGALTGALFGGIGGVGQVLGSSCKVLSFLGSTAKAIPIVSKIFGGISLGMAGFDLLAFGIGLFNPNNSLVKLNRKLHSNQLYNGIQIGVSVLAVFSGGFTQGMKNSTCFVAGTMILTATGLVAIENIRAGDVVISTNPDTMETGAKRVVETYVREDSKLIHLIINGEEIITTETHPFYVNNKGFVEAGGLKVGDELLDVNNNILLVEDYTVEITEEPITVYNFQVEDFHTYFVGGFGILVHNADKYGNGHYKNNPSDNKKVLADAEEDPSAVYGYKPRKDGSLKNLANEDWSNPEFVESARQKRLQYIADDKSIYDLISDMEIKDYSTEEIARAACDYRNQIRLNSYFDSNGNIINENGYNAALERMHTRSYDALISSGKTPEQIISSSTRTNPAMDACVGLYDENFNTY